jgi:hypothetical protein
MHGTGGEDYFNQAWGMQRNAFPMNGTIVHEEDVPGYQVSYRFHLADPVRFNRRIRVTMEHGHSNHLADDWASTAYWYQTLPGPQLTTTPVEQRLPRRAQVPPAADVGLPDRSALDDVRAAMLARRDARMSDFEAHRAEWLQRRVEDTRARQVANAEQAARLRAAFLESVR